VQGELLEAVLDSGTAVVVLVDSGRPYALGTAPQRAAAIVQAFFPGEEGGVAVAHVLSGAVNPSGRLPVSVPAHPGAQPWTYLAPTLAHANEVSNIDPTPAYGFGSGLGYTSFEWSDLTVDGTAESADAEFPTDGSVRVGVTVRNTGERSGTEVVQLYLHDPVATVTRPVIRLVAYARVELNAGASATIEFDVPADVTSFTGLAGRRVVEPGALEFRLGASSQDIRFTARVRATGPVRTVDHTRRLHAAVTIRS
jgi:beta-xylosidase